MNFDFINTHYTFQITSKILSFTLISNNLYSIYKMYYALQN